MKSVRRIIKDKSGEGYIDAAVIILCIMLVTALGVKLFPIFITKLQLDNFADELVREAEISGRVRKAIQIGVRLILITSTGRRGILTGLRDRETLSSVAASMMSAPSLPRRLRCLG